MVVTIKAVPLALMLGMSALLAGCGQTFQTSFSSASPANAAADWQVAEVRVSVPDSVTATEENSFIPKADIVWHGDPVGDRKAQTAAIVKAGVERGFAGLKGPKRVLVNVSLVRFHALTPLAYQRAPAGTGAHSVRFDMVVSDARTGAILSGPIRFDADLKAQTASEIRNSLEISASRVWKAEIENHIAATIRNWLGIGPDVQGSFQRLGG